MNLPVFIASRYLISRKKQHIINVISMMAVLGVTIGTMALVIVLSVFNGFEGLIKTFFSTLDPDLRLTPASGKFFTPDSTLTHSLKNHPSVAYYGEVIEEMALLNYEEKQYPAVVKGVPHNFNQITTIDSLIIDGNFTLENDDFDYAVVGMGVAHYLGIRSLLTKPVTIFAPKKGKKTSLVISEQLNQLSILPAGVFSVLEEIDSKYIFVPLRFARNLFETGSQVSAIEIKLFTGSDAGKIQKEFQKIAGNQLVVKNKLQLHDTLYKTMKSEKWATYLILVFILLIASFNILGSLTMLIIDKKNDISILRSMGADKSLIKKIFLIEGWLISILGAVLGIILGVFICYLQIHFKFITLPGAGSFVISAYPVEVHLFDIFIIMFIVLGIGFLAAWYPVRYISGRYFSEYTYE